MNEQRKVVYRRRQAILDGADLREEAMQTLAQTLDKVVSTFCPNAFHEDWDLPGLLHEVLNYFPSKFSVEELETAASPAAVQESLHAEAIRYYEQREQELGDEIMREIERRVMLSIIDQRWREHLYEMDYLQEGINLRAMGQKDPLVEWQREGYDMFTQMTEAIADDFVRYVMHLDVVVQPSAAPVVQNVQYSAPVSPVLGSGSIRPAVAEVQAASGESADGGGGSAVAVDEAPVQQVVKSAEEKIGRNAPCYCGSGKKYKLCHGRPGAN
jgi:preprotein translocase subunit SecA